MIAKPYLSRRQRADSVVARRRRSSLPEDSAVHRTPPSGASDVLSLLGLRAELNYCDTPTAVVSRVFSSGFFATKKL